MIDTEPQRADTNEKNDSEDKIIPCEKERARRGNGFDA
jgi:hypothetical protein